MAAEGLRANTLAQAVRILDGKRPLEYLSPEWKAFYTETNRPEVDLLIEVFMLKGLGYKALFGGHSGNGKTTELNRFKGSERIQERFWVISADVAESLNPMDLEIVELLLLMTVETLAFADAHGVVIDEHLRQRFLELEGVFKGELVIEDHRLSGRDISAEFGTEAEAGFPGFFVKLKAKLLAKIKTQLEYRHSVRQTFRPRLNDLIDLLDDLYSVLLNSPGSKLPLMVIDGLDRMGVPSAQQLFAHDSQILAQIRNASILLTVPISVIHSPVSAQIQLQLGDIHVFKNLRLHNRTGDVDQAANKNRQYLRNFVLLRIDAALIEDAALDKAITYSGGVFRTLLDLLSEAGVIASANKVDQIGLEEMDEALRVFRINKARPMRRKHWLILDVIDREGILHDDNDPNAMEILQGLYALEYDNGEGWYALNPLLTDGLARFRKIENAERQRNAGS